MSHKHYNIYQKRAAVNVYNEAMRWRKEHPEEPMEPIHIASVAAGGASSASVYSWMNLDLSMEALEAKEERRGGVHKLSRDQERLLVGFASDRRHSHQVVSLEILQEFCDCYFSLKVSSSILSRAMHSYGFSSLKAMSRNSRMTTREVVEDALSSVEEIRSHDFTPDRIIFMDETGLWSNVTAPRTYHFKNWCAIKPLL